jgi:hypothetical protein
MHSHDLEWVLARQPKAPLKFSYFRDQFALSILRWVIGEGRRVCDLRRGPHAKLLEKPCMRQVLARVKRGVLTPSDLDSFEAKRQLEYRLSFAAWGEADERKWCPTCHQTTRPGQNLVVQLNFAREHDTAYFGLIAPRGIDDHLDHPFVCAGHPVSQHHLTLAWARVDIAFEAGEALIEEVQSDWVKRAASEADALRALEPETLMTEELCGFDPEIATYHVLSYVDHVLQPHIDTWAEAMLAATLHCLRDRYDIRRIFYNTFETGCYLKGLGAARPPRSLYTGLPRRFGFQQTETRPWALRRSATRSLQHKLARPGLSWFLLEL